MFEPLEYFYPINKLPQKRRLMPIEAKAEPRKGTLLRHRAHVASRERIGEGFNDESVERQLSVPVRLQIAWCHQAHAGTGAVGEGKLENAKVSGCSTSAAAPRPFFAANTGSSPLDPTSSGTPLSSMTSEVVFRVAEP